MSLPTRVPGVFFEGRGRIWCRVIPPEKLGAADFLHPNAAAARAAAFAGINQIASEITEGLFPEKIFEADQRLTMALAKWRRTSVYQDVTYRGSLRLRLSERDRARAEAFTASRRAARLKVVLAEDALESLCESHLADINRAQLWWLNQYLSQPSPDLSWEAFDKHIRPLVASTRRPMDEVDRLAHILLTATDRVSEDPQLKRTLLHILQRLFEMMDWPDLVVQINNLAQPGKDPCPRNGAVPAENPGKGMESSPK